MVTVEDILEIFPWFLRFVDATYYCEFNYVVNEFDSVRSFLVENHPEFFALKIFPSSPSTGLAAAASNLDFKAFICFLVMISSFVKVL